MFEFISIYISIAVLDTSGEKTPDCSPSSIDVIKSLLLAAFLGFYPYEMKRLVLRENIWITIFGLPFGYILGSLLLRVILKQATTPDLKILPLIAVFSIALSFFLILAFTMLVNYLMGRKFKGIDMVASLKSVE